MRFARLVGFGGLAISAAVPVVTTPSALAAQAVGRVASIGGPITISGQAKPLSRGVEIAVDPATGNGLAVWNRNGREQAFGEIWAAELIRQPSAGYAVGKAFRFSQSSPAQRPTVEFLPDLDLYMVMWDQGPRDRDQTSGASQIVARLYAPAEVTARTGELGPEAVMTDGGTNLSPGLVYVGPSSIYERLAYAWTNATVPSARGVPQPPGAGFMVAAPSDVRAIESILRGHPTSPDHDNPLTWKILDTLTCGESICFLVARTGDTKPPYTVNIELLCFEVSAGSPRLDLVSRTEVTSYVERESTDRIDGSLRKVGDCAEFSVLTDRKIYIVDPIRGTSTHLAVVLEGPSYYVPPTFGLPAPRATRAVGDDGVVSHWPGRGTFHYRAFESDGSLATDPSDLWKIKRQRLADMDVQTAGDTVLVAWTEKKNRSGSKSIVRVGWFGLD